MSDRMSGEQRAEVGRLTEVVISGVERAHRALTTQDLCRAGAHLWAAAATTSGHVVKVCALCGAGGASRG